VVEKYLIAGQGSLTVRLATTLEAIVSNITVESVPPHLQKEYQSFTTFLEESILELEPVSVQKKMVGNVLAFYEAFTLACTVAPEALPTAIPLRNPKALKHLLKQAIAKQRKIAFDYKGHHRVGDVYIYGTSPSGKQAIQLYQTAGTSSTGTLHQFKYYLLESMRHVQLLETPFTPAFERLAPYNPESSFFEEVFEQV
jgi:hypothetical protein